MKKKDNQSKRGLGIEGIFIFLDYYSSLSRRKAICELFTPFVIAIMCSLIYLSQGLVHSALQKLSDILPAAVSVLIGFSAMIVTLLTTGESKRVNELREISTGKEVRGKPLTYYQKILIQNIHVLFNEIILLLVVFIFLYLNGLKILNDIWLVVFLAIETYLLINVLVSIFGTIATIYFAFYNSSKD